MYDTIHPTSTVYAKTVLGQQEIQSRALGLSPLVRRLLVLVDGKRSGTELAVFLSGQGEVAALLEQLHELGCIEAQVQTKAPAAVPASVAPSAPSAASPAGPVEIKGLPPAESRSKNDNEMARNFMINSINAIIGQNTRVSLVHDIFHAETTEQLRTAYQAWVASMSNHGMGAKRLPELREKLFKVL